MKKLNESELDNLQMALRYAALGWPVFPVWGIKGGRCLCGGVEGCRPGKHPFGRAVPRGHHDATTDPDILRRWFVTPFINVGVDVGRANAVVLDVDAKHGGLETLARLEAQLGPLPQCPVAETGGGGRHYWFAACLKITKNIKLPGIDVLVGGAVIMSPSLHISGKRYGWRTEPETPRPPLPQAMVEYIIPTQPQVSGNKKASIVPDGSVFDPMRGRVTATGVTFDTLGQLPSGARNAEVTRVIGAMLAAGLSAEAVLAAGQRWAEAQVPPYSLADLRSKVRWIANRHGSTGGGWHDDDPEPLDGEPADGDVAEEEDGPQTVVVDGLSTNPEFLAALAELEDVSTPPMPTGQLPSPPAAAEEEVLTVPEPLLLPPRTSAAAVGGPASSSASFSATSFAATSSAAAPDNSKGYLPPTVKQDAEPQTAAAGKHLLPPLAAPRLPNNPTPVRRSNGVPPGVPPAICHGLFGEYLMAVWRLTEAGPFGVLLCAITAFGSAVGRLPHLLAGGVQRANLFLLLVGDTADRKGTAWSVGGEPIRLADPQWADARIIPGFGSGEGLVFAGRPDALGTRIRTAVGRARRGLRWRHRPPRRPDAATGAHLRSGRWQ